MILARGWINMYYTHRMIQVHTIRIYIHTHQASENYIVYAMALIASDQYTCIDNKW